MAHGDAIDAAGDAKSSLGFMGPGLSVACGSGLLHDRQYSGIANKPRKSLMKTRDKIAVVVIHGMGEIRPMQTLRGFVASLWSRDASLFEGVPTKPYRKGETWTKPDPRAGGSDLRRITTGRARDPERSGTDGIRADFFELHWADITADSTWRDFLDWYGKLLLRNPLRGWVPSRVLLVWILCWLLTLLIVLVTVTAVIGKVGMPLPAGLQRLAVMPVWTWLTLVLLLMGGVFKRVLTATFGNVARYLTASPRNIRVRQAARDRGQLLLSELAGSDEYQRIIVVGHSLGSVLAHDLVANAWAGVNQKIVIEAGTLLAKAVDASESAALALLRAAQVPAASEPAGPQSSSHYEAAGFRAKEPAAYRSELRAFRDRQRDLFAALVRTTIEVGERVRPAWLISDLVTIGSPLTYADFLLADGGRAFAAASRAREVLRSPPVFEQTPSGQLRITYEHDGKRYLHHAAATAAMRWTNVHDETHPLWFLNGDLISGSWHPCTDLEYWT